MMSRVVFEVMPGVEEQAWTSWTATILTGHSAKPRELAFCRHPAFRIPSRPTALVHDPDGRIVKLGRLVF
jgi:hypothetical protein